MKLYSIGLILCNEELDKPIILTYSFSTYFCKIWFVREHIRDKFLFCFRTFIQYVGQNTHKSFVYEDLHCHTYLQSYTQPDLIPKSTFNTSLKYLNNSKLGVMVITDKDYPERSCREIVMTAISRFSKSYDGQWQFSEKDFQFPEEFAQNILDEYRKIKRRPEEDEDVEVMIHVSDNSELLGKIVQTDTHNCVIL